MLAGGLTAAPTMTGSDIIVAVPLAKSWTLLDEASGWGSWNKDVTGVRAEGAAAASGALSPSAQAMPAFDLAAGSAFSYQWQGVTVNATVVGLTESAQLAWQGAFSGKKVLMRWTLKSTDAAHTLISLRAAYDDGDAFAGKNAGAETGSWISAFQDAAEKLAAAAPAPVPTPAPKHHHHKKAPASAQPTSATAAATGGH
jgi:hypothetical protein